MEKVNKKAVPSTAIPGAANGEKMMKIVHVQCNTEGKERQG